MVTFADENVTDV